MKRALSFQYFRDGDSFIDGPPHCFQYDSSIPGVLIRIG